MERKMLLLLGIVLCVYDGGVGGRSQGRRSACLPSKPVTGKTYLQRTVRVGTLLLSVSEI